MPQMSDSKLRQEELLSDFLKQHPEKKISCVSLAEQWKYFYFVPLTDVFYGDAKLGLRETTAASEWSHSSVADHSVFKSIKPTWVDAVNAALQNTCPEAQLLFLDVGLFVGMVSLHANQHLHPGKTALICVEPNLENEVLARLNFGMNGVDATIFSGACSDEEGEVSFWVPKGVPISGRISTRADRHTFTVQTRRVDSLLEEFRPTYDYSIIKIDTEGAEWSVLRGIGSATLRKTLAIILEYWPTEDLEYERYLIENFQVFDIKSTMFSLPLPYAEFESADSLARTCEAMIQKHKNVDVLLVPRLGSSEAHDELCRIMSTTRQQDCGNF